MMPVLVCEIVQWLLSGQDARDAEGWESIITAYSVLCIEYTCQYMSVRKASACQHKEKE